MTVGKTYLERYVAGEYEQVWDELVALGEPVREEPVYTDAWAVACETMRRVKHNIELLIPRLRDLGWVFGHAWAVQWGALKPEEVADLDREYPLLETPLENVGALIEEVERRAGILPLSMRAFYEIVGGVSIIGAHPNWNGHQLCQLDPLEVLSASAILRLDEWFQWTSPDDRLEDGSCALPVAPDQYFKYLYSGGGHYAIPLRAAVADAPLLYEWHHTTFVNYLRLCLRWGGLPGLEQAAIIGEGELAALTRDLLPI